MKNTRTAILLMNVGSPDSPTKPAVRRYLSEFLNDKRVIDLPWLARKILVNGIIVPFRVKKSTKLYTKLWTKKGSPLICLSEKLRLKLQAKMGEEYSIFMGMRYGNPGYKKALSEIKKQRFKHLVVLPLFPQHALSTTETAFVAVEKEIKKLRIDSKVLKIGQFYQHPGFIKAFTEQIQKYPPESFDHLLFSFHGIPDRQDTKSQPDQWKPDKKYSYREACFETALLISKKLNISASDFSVGFQSRLSNNWLVPFSDDILLQKIKEGKKKILVAAPSFVADCLETIVEIKQDYRKIFLKNGGEKLHLVEGLNAEDPWVEALNALIQDARQYDTVD